MSLSLDVNATRASSDRIDDASPPLAQSNDQSAAPAHTASAEIFWNPQLANVIKTALAANAPVGPAATSGAGFDAEVRGTDPKAIDQTLAKLSQDVYDVPAAG